MNLLCSRGGVDTVANASVRLASETSRTCVSRGRGKKKSRGREKKKHQCGLPLRRREPGGREWKLGGERERERESTSMSVKIEEVLVHLCH